ncbi:MAG TPA: LiaF domain-containing protein [Anaerolineaceae bacterium]
MNTVFTGTTVLIGGAVAVVLLGGAFGLTTRGSSASSKTLTDTLSEPRNGASSARFDLNVGTGNLYIDTQVNSGTELASGTLQYAGKQGPPARSLTMSSGKAVLTVRGDKTGRTGFRFPWEACNGATDWQIHLNPAVAADLTAHSGGGNIKIDLSGMNVSSISTDTGGGNIDLVLPDGAANLLVTAQSGAGNVTVRAPRGAAIKVTAASGMGKIMVDPQITQVDKTTFQSPGYDTAAQKIELTLKSGAGNVTVVTQ